MSTDHPPEISTEFSTETSTEFSPERGTERGTVLVTGVTGYVGSRLVIPLIEAGWTVRVLTRTPDRLTLQPWRHEVDVVAGDASDVDDLGRALHGVTAAYYLLHSMGGEGDFVERDRALARTFATSAEAAGVERLVYLSGLHPGGDLSPHLSSRVEVGEILLESSVPTAVLQAAVIVGSGSASFEMMRHLADRLPAMVAPKWLGSHIQPIAIRDVVHYLVGAADLPSEVNRTFDIGGPDILTYGDMLKRFARVAGLRPRPIATVPVLTPGLASHWVGLVTPVPSGIARPLVSSLVHDVVCREADILDHVPEPPGGPLGFDEAVERALAAPQEQVADGGLVHPPLEAVWPGDPDWAGPGRVRL
jgi:uncharacterized protein YbjT (DUF2867 family)